MTTAGIQLTALDYVFHYCKKIYIYIEKKIARLYIVSLFGVTSDFDYFRDYNVAVLLMTKKNHSWGLGQIPLNEYYICDDIFGLTKSS